MGIPGWWWQELRLAWDAGVQTAVDAMSTPSDVIQLERDFLSGRNPLGYLPLCQALRRQKNYARALEICARGLARDPDSVAGRTMHVRLLGDLGRYEEALREIARVETRVPDAMGLTVEKARCLVKLRRLDEARSVLDRLSARNPMAPEVQDLTAALSRAHRQQTSGNNSSSMVEIPRILRTNTGEVLAALLSEMRQLVNIKSAAVIPTAAGIPALEGDPMQGEVAYEFYKEAGIACSELEAGKVHLGIIETDNLQIIVLVRQKAIVAISFEPTMNLGKILHRFQIVVGQLLPDAV